ncbi:hypothetical protein NKDENANG_03089 [Candidatus Entotheonellaceae bacterium PAL068K]
MHRFLVTTILLLSVVLGLSLESADDITALRMIIVQDKREARDILRQLRQGTSFSALAGSKSTGPARLAWGYSGTFHVTELQPELRPILQKLRPGQISDILEINGNFIIVKVISPQIERHYAAADRARAAGDIKRAVQELKAALRLEKDSVQTHLKLGMIYTRAARYEEAFPLLEKAHRYVPQATQIAIMRAATYTHAAIARKNRTYAQKALQVYKQALRMDERFAPSMHFGMGKVYLVALHQPAKAIVHLEKAVQITPDVPEVYGLLIQAYHDTRRYEKAWQHLRLAQSLGFEFPELRQTLHKIKQQRQR